MMFECPFSDRIRQRFSIVAFGGCSQCGTTGGLLHLMLITCESLCNNQISELRLLCIHVGCLGVVMKLTYLTSNVIY